MASVAELVERLADLTEEHVAAATQMDAGRVQDLTTRRADLQFELRVLLRASPKLEGEARTRARAATLRLAHAERRFERVVGVVVRGLGGAPTAPTTYGRHGRMGRSPWG